LITIIVIFCQQAKDLEKQYTMRMLPPFVIPYCVICRETVLAYLRLYPDGPIHSAIASQMMGTVDMRTVRRHLRRATQLISDATLALWEFLDALPIGTPLPHHGGASPIGLLDMAAQGIDREAARVPGALSTVIPVIVYVHALDVYARARQPIVPVSTLVLRAVFFHDTS
jgi:hypothetical protein